MGGDRPATGRGGAPGQNTEKCNGGVGPGRQGTGGHRANAGEGTALRNPGNAGWAGTRARTGTARTSPAH
eukprot:9835865-Lingulodinium_polyedra.AAC.1